MGFVRKTLPLFRLICDKNKVYPSFWFLRLLKRRKISARDEVNKGKLNDRSIGGNNFSFVMIHFIKGLKLEENVLSWQLLLNETTQRSFSRNGCISSKKSVARSILQRLTLSSNFYCSKNGNDALFFPFFRLHRQKAATSYPGKLSVRPFNWIQQVRLFK